MQGLTITSTASTASATPGTTVQYTITVTNSGQAAYTGASISDSLAGVLDDAVYNGDAAATVGSVSYASPNLTWTGNLAAGATATITFSATVSNPDTGDKVLATTITSPTPASNCPAGGTDPACSTSVTVLVPAPDHRHVLRRLQHHAGIHGGLHGHGDQLRADALHRDERRRLPGRGAR